MEPEDKPEPEYYPQKKYREILEEIKKLSKGRKVKLLPVTKYSEPTMVYLLYSIGVKEYGENYVAKLVEKAELMPKDIQWHLIGHLQSNKVKFLLSSVPNVIIETVDSKKIAKEINDTCVKLGINELKVYVQVNISKEETKSGADIKDVDDIVKEIVQNCDRLKLCGVMSLGNIGAKDEFAEMIEIKKKICETYGFDPNDFTASFGTSQDYKDAVLCQSDEVRVGRTIFQ